MDKFERSQELERLQSECRALEEKAGLSQVMERAREGRFIPLGALGEKVTPDEYFADEHDHLRRKTRGAYFSVSELALRKNLIASARKVESCYRQSLEEDFIAANRAVLTARAKAQRQPWGKAAIFGVGAVVAGYWAFGMVGAIAGAVGGFFLGQGAIAESRNEANEEIAQASAELEQVQKDKTEQFLMPEFFGNAEEFSGERDERIDHESAYANTLQKRAVG